MAKSRSRRERPQSLQQLLRPVVVLPRPIVTPSSQNLIEIEDRRTYHPDPVRPARSLDRSNHQLVTSGSATKQVSRPFSFKRPFSSVPAAISFDQPAKVAVCIRRKTRKQVLFAKKKTGKGARSKKHRNPYSNIRCT